MGSLGGKQARLIQEKPVCWNLETLACCNLCLISHPRKQQTLVASHPYPPGALDSCSCQWLPTSVCGSLP